MARGRDGVAIDVKIQFAAGADFEHAQLRVAGRTVPVERRGDRFVFTIDRVGEHEMVVLE